MCWGQLRQDGVTVPGGPGVKDCVVLCVPTPLGLELQAGRGERLPGVLGPLVTTLFPSGLTSCLASSEGARTGVRSSGVFAKVTEGRTRSYLTGP